MKKIGLVTIALSCALASSAFAADKKTLHLTPTEANAIAGGLLMLGGHDVVVKDARGQDSAVHEQFKMAGTLPLTLGRDLSILRSYLQEAENAAKGVTAPAGLSAADAAKSVSDQISAINSTEEPIEVLTFDSKDLAVGPDNPYKVEALSYIEPLFIDYVAPVIPHIATPDEIAHKPGDAPAAK